MASPAIDLLLRCDPRGRVLDLWSSPELPAPATSPGDTLAPLVAAASAPHALDLLFALRRQGAVFGWPLALRWMDGERTLEVAAIAASTAVLLAADGERGRLAAFCRRLLAGDEVLGLVPGTRGRARLRRELAAAGEAAAGPVPVRARLLRRLGRRLVSASLPAAEAELARAVHRHAGRLVDELDGEP